MPLSDILKRNLERAAADMKRTLEAYDSAARAARSADAVAAELLEKDIASGVVNSNVWSSIPGLKDLLEIDKQKNLSTRKVVFQGVEHGRYDLEIRACVYCNELLDGADPSLALQVRVVMDGEEAASNTFKVTANPKSLATSRSIIPVTSVGYIREPLTIGPAGVKKDLTVTAEVLGPSGDDLGKIIIQRETVIGFRLSFIGD
ncbi:MAG: hypothetical protein AB7G93_15365 [Bdellovibrionales bacterium]